MRVTDGQAEKLNIVAGPTGLTSAEGEEFTEADE